MKKVALLLLVASLVTSLPAFAATLSLRATWTANTEADMKEYRLYRTDGTTTLTGTVPHPTVTYSFSVNVPDGSSGTLTFVLRAVDTSDNESTDSSSVTYIYNLDGTPPAPPINVRVIK
jgi:hypothetical protein